MMEKVFEMINGVSVDVTTVFDKTETWKPTIELSERVIEEMTWILNLYQPGRLREKLGLYIMFGVDGIFWKQNGWLIKKMEKSEYYNGNLQLVIRDQDMRRYLNTREIWNFKQYVNGYLWDKVYYLDSEGKRYTLSERNERISELRERTYYINGCFSEDLITREQWEEEHSKINRDYDALSDEHEDNNNRFARQTINYLCDRVIDTGDWLVDDYIAEHVMDTAKYFGIKLRTSAGQKITRLVGKIARMTDIVKHSNIVEESFIMQNGDIGHRTRDIGWNTQFASFGDATSPNVVKGTAIFSLHPVDFTGMSLGTTWSSCMTPDKENTRDLDDNYHGMYFGGTESYMLDNSTFLFYYLPQEFNGDRPEKEFKIKRCLFMIGEDKLVQSRLYPDGRDGGDDRSLVADVRALAQKIVSEMFEVPNYWTVEKSEGSGRNTVCPKVIRSTGSHYRDYEHYQDPNVSFLKRIDGYKNMRPIYVGHSEICPECGEEHWYEENVFCTSCAERKYECTECGEFVDEDDIYFIDGYPYCRDCVDICENCGEAMSIHTGYETHEYDCVCERCIDNYYVWSEVDEEYVRDYYSVETEEGNYYHRDSCSYFVCDHCGEYHDSSNCHEHDWEHLCDDCYEDVIAAERADAELSRINNAELDVNEDDE